MYIKVEEDIIKKGRVHRTAPPGVKRVELTFDEEAMQQLAYGIRQPIKLLLEIDIAEQCIQSVVGAIKGSDDKEIEILRTYLGHTLQLSRNELMETRLTPAAKIFILIIQQINRGVPVSTELITALAIKYDIPKEDIISLNMSVRSLLFLLKFTGCLQIFVDDEHYDSKAEIVKLIGAATQSLQYIGTIADIYNEELKTMDEYPFYDPIKAQVSVEDVIEQVYLLYLVNAGTVTSPDEFWNYFIKEKERNPVEVFDILASAMIILRAYFIQNSDKINEYHRKVFKDMY